jgi:hypothetical protein
VARHIFQACPVWIYTQSNITNIMTSIANWSHQEQPMHVQWQLCEAF